MASNLLLILLLANNRYFFHYVVLVLVVLVYHAQMSLHVIERSYLLFNGYSSIDPLTLSIILIGAVVTIGLLVFYGDLYKLGLFQVNNEFIALIVLLIVGIGGLVVTNSYLNLFVAIELQSLVLYILLASTVTPNLLVNTSKVSLSYLINAAMATALLLFGLSVNSNWLVLIAIVWKLGVIPLHVWSLPILDNQHTLITAIYLTLAKYGILVVIALIASSSTVTMEALTYIGLANLIVGNVLGLLQYRYQRIIVYSSMIQIGYMLLVLSNQTSIGLTYFEMYSVYTVLLLLLWIVPTYSQLYSGQLLPQVQLWVLILVLYTVAGLPFFPLFWTKLDILLTIQTESLMIALVSTLLSSLIYIRLIKYMSFFRS